MAQLRTPGAKHNVNWKRKFGQDIYRGSVNHAGSPEQDETVDRSGELLRIWNEAPFGLETQSEKQPGQTEHKQPKRHSAYRVTRLSVSHKIMQHVWMYTGSSCCGVQSSGGTLPTRQWTSRFRKGREIFLCRRAAISFRVRTPWPQVIPWFCLSWALIMFSIRSSNKVSPCSYSSATYQRHVSFLQDRLVNPTQSAQKSWAYNSFFSGKVLLKPFTALILRTNLYSCRATEELPLAAAHINATCTLISRHRQLLIKFDQQHGRRNVTHRDCMCVKFWNQVTYFQKKKSNVKVTSLPDTHVVPSNPLH